jgi:hypothetical protein
MQNCMLFQHTSLRSLCRGWDSVTSIFADTDFFRPQLSPRDEAGGILAVRSPYSHKLGYACTLLIPTHANKFARVGFLSGQAPDGACLRAGPRGARLLLSAETRTSLRASNPTRIPQTRNSPLLTHSVRAEGVGTLTAHSLRSAFARCAFKTLGFE